MLCGSIARPLRPGAEGRPSTSTSRCCPPSPATKARSGVLLRRGPGRAATRLLSPISTLLKRLNNRRDIVFIDQRGTGRNAPLYCPEQPPTTPLKELMAAGSGIATFPTALSALQALPHGDLRYYATPMAMADADAVREALGASQINVIGGSYGTRAALDYLRQFPGSVRRTVIDGVAPPDGHLPDSLARRRGGGVFDLACGLRVGRPRQKRYPGLRRDLGASAGQPAARGDGGASLHRRDRDADPDPRGCAGPGALAALRAQLGFWPCPCAKPGGGGHPESLLGLSLALSTGDAMRLALGMHFSVICTEDFPAAAALGWKLRRCVAGGGISGQLPAPVPSDLRSLAARHGAGRLPPLPTASTATLVFSAGSTR